VKTLKPGRRHVQPEVQLRAAFDVLDRNGLTATNEPVRVDMAPTSFSTLSDQEMDMLVALLRKAGLQLSS
jgi:hypothetical protein